MNTQKNDLVSVGRLESLLKIWEDTLLWARLGLKSARTLEEAQSIKGSVINWDKLRKELLSRKPLDHSLFETPKLVVEQYFLRSPVLENLPFFLESWSVSSRHVYSLSDDTQRSLEITSIGKTTWSDVVLPFSTFGVTLPIPIKWANCGRSGEIDFILVTSSGREIKLIAVGSEIDERQPLTTERRNRVMKAIRRNEFGTISAMIHGWKECHSMIPASNMLCYHMDDSKAISDEVDYTTILGPLETECDEHTQKMPDYCKLILRIVVGLCQRIADPVDTNSERDVSKGTWSRNVPSLLPPIDGGSITDEAQVCSVKLRQPLSQEGVAFHKEIRSVGIITATREVAAHHRRSYLRRPPGLGHNPLAAKTVRVREAFVNEHLLPEYGLPLGSNVPVT